MEWLKLLLNPGIVWALIPLGGIALGALRVWCAHQETLARLQTGLEPERARPYRD